MLKQTQSLWRQSQVLGRANWIKWFLIRNYLDLQGTCGSVQRHFGFVAVVECGPWQVKTRDSNYVYCQTTCDAQIVPSPNWAAHCCLVNETVICILWSKEVSLQKSPICQPRSYLFLSWYQWLGPYPGMEGLHYFLVLFAHESGSWHKRGSDWLVFEEKFCWDREFFDSMLLKKRCGGLLRSRGGEDGQRMGLRWLNSHSSSGLLFVFVLFFHTFLCGKKEVFLSWDTIS